jgi:CHAD domain-containing protein
MSSGRAHDERASARALDKAVRRTWREWHAVTLKARRDPGSRRLVHRFRIATRRLLAVEDLLAAGGPGSPIRERLDPAFRVAGRIRDLQICRAELAGLDDHRAAVRAVARAARKRLPVLVERLRHELRAFKPREIRQAVRPMRARLHAATDSAAARRTRTRTIATARLRHRAARQQLDRFARNLGPETDDAALHSLRLRLKGVRYMTELLASVDTGERARVFETWQRALGAVTDLRAVLREIDRCRVHRQATEAALGPLRQFVLRAQRRHIRALFGRRPAAQARTRQLRLLHTAPLA